LTLIANGGRFAPESVATYTARLEGMHAHMSAVQGQECQQVLKLHEELTKACDAARDAVMADIPAHQEDLVVIEAIKVRMDDARRCGLREPPRSHIQSLSKLGVMHARTSCRSDIDASHQCRHAMGETTARTSHAVFLTSM
jgi:hypothetical protein